MQILVAIVSCFWIAALRLIRPAVKSNAELWQSDTAMQYRDHLWRKRKKYYDINFIYLIVNPGVGWYTILSPITIKTQEINWLQWIFMIGIIVNWSWHVHIPDKNKWSRQSEIIMDSSQEINKEMSCPPAGTVGRKSLFVQSTDRGVTEYL